MPSANSKQPIDKPPSYIYISLAILWLYSGVVPLLFACSQSLAMLEKMGVEGHWQWLLFITASLIDMIFCLLLLTKIRHHAWFWALQLLTVLGYSVLIAIFLPENWFHPFAPLIKNVPIMALLAWLYQYHNSLDLSDNSAIF